MATFKVVEYDNEVEKDLWDSEYRFGKYQNALCWIPYFNTKYDKLLTKKALYAYVQNYVG